ncbi:157_t:CDS:2, partial [Cetraspora pellucida]
MKLKVGESAINSLETHRYGQFQYMVQEFYRHIKLSFTGNKDDFKVFDLDIEELCSMLKHYVTGTEREQLEQDEWIIELKFKDVKEKIIRLISRQLSAGGVCTIMFLVSGFSESKYLQSRIKKIFNYIKTIAVSKQPQVVIVHDALEYGLKMDVIKTRVLKYTNDIEIENVLNEATDPENLRIDGHYIFKFYQLIEKDQEVGVDETF